MVADPENHVSTDLADDRTRSNKLEVAAYLEETRMSSATSVALALVSNAQQEYVDSDHADIDYRYLALASILPVRQADSGDRRARWWTDTSYRSALCRNSSGHRERTSNSTVPIDSQTGNHLTSGLAAEPTAATKVASSSSSFRCRRCNSKNCSVPTCNPDWKNNKHRCRYERPLEQPRSSDKTGSTTSVLNFPGVVRPHPIKTFAPILVANTVLRPPLLVPTPLQPQDFAFPRSTSTTSETSATSRSCGVNPRPQYFSAQALETSGRAAVAQLLPASLALLETRQAAKLKLRKLKRQQLLQEVQCNFSNCENASSVVMPPTNSGQATGGGAVEETAPAPIPLHLPGSTGRSDQRHRQLSSGVSSNGGNVRPRSLHDEDDADEDGRRGHTQPTPLFERLVTEEVQELKAYARIIESQQRRLAELELVHGDLEGRLEIEARARQQLEATLEAREREWTNRFKDLKTDRDHWKEVVNIEQTKNSRLIDQVVRKDQDIHRMLQRKVQFICGVLPRSQSKILSFFLPQYDNDPSINRSVRNVRGLAGDRGERTVASASKAPEARADFQKSPHEILAASGSVERVRTRNVKSLLFDFFGM